MKKCVLIRSGSVVLAVAAALSAGHKAEGQWLLGAEPARQAGQAKQAARVPTEEIIVALHESVDAAQFAREYNLKPRYALRSDAQTWVFAARSAADAEPMRLRLLKDKRVRHAFANARVSKQRFNFVPNDPYFYPAGNAAAAKGQWYLQNTIIPGYDLRVLAPWSRDITGAGVVVCLIDDGMQINHPDLAPNYDAADSYNFYTNTPDPSPVYGDDNHGTACAGLLAARGGDGIGITGAAPFATLACLRQDFHYGTDAQFADSALYHSSGANTSIKIKSSSYGYPEPYIDDTPECNALSAAAAFGTIHCYAAGNDRGGPGQDVNKKQTPANPDAIVVAAIDSTGAYSFYSDFGANLTCTSLSGGYYTLTLLTTDRTGANGYNFDLASNYFPDLNYTQSFSGTSGATPLAAGVLALVKQAQPALNTRFAKHLIARTSHHVHTQDVSVASDGGWRANAAGVFFNQNYGFGLINADGLTQQAVQFTGVTPLAVVDVGPIAVNAFLPDNDAAGINRTFTINATAPLEEIQVTLNITHPSRGNMEAYLTSPSGTTRRLFIQASDDTKPDIHWTFASNAFWGENPYGAWTLNVRDVIAGFDGTWDDFSVHARMGTLLATAAGTVTLQDSVNANQPITFTFRPADGSASFTRTQTLLAAPGSSRGAFQLPNIPAGLYNVAIRGANFLQRVVTVDTRNGSVTNLTAALLGGDANGNNLVDIGDFGLLVNAYGGDTNIPNSGYDTRADFNDDGIVDIGDFGILVNNYATQGDM